MRVVLDTNVYVSAFIGQADSCREILRELYRQHYTLLVSNAIINEINNILWLKAEQCRLSREEKIELNRKFVTAISWAESVTVKTKVNYCREDPSDNKFISCAIDGNADYIISGDESHLLSIKDVILNKTGGVIKIISPETFMKVLLMEKVNKRRLV